MNQVVAIKAMQLIITNINALLAEIIPAGISRIAVRGFLASKLLSSQRLKAIAALRAKTIQRMTNNNLKPMVLQFGDDQPIISFKLHSPGRGSLSIPRQNPINANGIAKIVCENFTRLKYFLTINTF